jgi:CubicO group peptidase (beta-lactamase class C family)
VRFACGLATLAALIFAAGSFASPAADGKTVKADKLFSARDKTTTRGAALAVIKDGRIVYGRGYGMAKLEDGIVNTPDKVFDIGSVSKQFTAACVAFLIREGKVGLHDDIRKYLPEPPAYEKPVTVDHLLHHTSGPRDYNALLSLAGFRPESDAPTVEEAYKIIRRQNKLNCPPGQEFRFEKAAPLRTPGASEPAEYAGIYVSEELLDVRYSLSVANDQLMLKTRTIPRTALKAMAPDKYAFPEQGFNVEFTRDENGRADGFTVSAGRAAGIAFSRRQP